MRIFFFWGGGMVNIHMLPLREEELLDGQCKSLSCENQKAPM